MKRRHRAAHILFTITAVKLARSNLGSEGMRGIPRAGRVQGVAFRPTVWRLAREYGLSGEVRNDPAGVLIRVTGMTTNASLGS